MTDERPLLKHSGHLSRDLRRRINTRAHELAKAIYAEYCDRMKHDARVIGGLVSPEEWVPEK